MITTISLSPAIDKRLEFEHFSIGGTNRVRRAEAEGAGKAVNVALGLQALGLSALCAGILPAPGSVRVNQKLFDRSTQVLTEINESCPPMTPELVAAAEELAVAHAKESEFLVLTGSLPPKCPADWYARVLRRVHREAPQCRVVLDAEGERFALAVAEKPWLVKPNQYELGLFAGRPLDTREDILAAARALNRRGVEVVVVSMGKDGALAVRGEEDVFVPAMKIDVHTTVGAGDVFAVVQYVALISSALMTTFWTLAWLPHLKVCAKRVGEVLSLKGIEKSGEPPKKLSGDLTLKGVSFRYPDSREYSLKDVDMTFPEGKTIAVIGGTGSGKSTLIKLLLDFYPVTDGEISFGNENYSSLGGSDIRGSVACAMQKSMIFEGTIRDNVKIAREDATDEEVSSAIEDARLLDFVKSQKDGLDYFLSQSGANLSGGQKQRVNIARTILKNASVYIFDDSFSALDLLTEKNLRAALNRRLKGKTQIIITQRVSTARKCDYIYVLDDGKLVGGGNHEFLIENCKTYGEIYLSQTGGYDENEA